jgi:hypothetical protein
MRKSCMHAISCGYAITSFWSMSLAFYISQTRTHGKLHSAGATHSVLNEAIFAYMNEIGEGHHEDIVRAFFRYKVGEIGNLLPHVMEITRKSAYELGRSLSAALPEANRIVLVNFTFSLEQMQCMLTGDHFFTRPCSRQQLTTAITTSESTVSSFQC